MRILILIVLIFFAKLVNAIVSVFNLNVGIFLGSGFGIECNKVNCNMAYHPECARRSKVYLELKGKVRVLVRVVNFSRK